MRSFKGSLKRFWKNFRRKKPRVGTVRQSLAEKAHIAIKCIAMLVIPLPLPALATYFWYNTLYLNDIHFNEKLEGIATAAWLPGFCIIWSLLAGMMMTTVWNKYLDTRTSVKEYNFKKFFMLRDEEISPLAHTLMLVLSTSIINGFMGLKYPDFVSGALVVFSTAYLFTLVFVVITEIDDPFYGIWFIQNVHEEWMRVDPKEWREDNCLKEKKAFQHWLTHRKKAT